MENQGIRHRNCCQQSTSENVVPPVPTATDIFAANIGEIVL